jgi:2-hydroxychromene-2-carboxylate isomerase
MPKLEFWYDFASTYSYLSAMRIEAAAADAGVEIVYRPFLLGPIFKAQGWDTSPFNLYPAKGRYMIRDMERLSALRGLPFRMPNSFPAMSLKAARLALVAEREGFVAPLTRAVFEAEFGAGRDIADDAVLSTVMTGLGLDFARISAASSAPEIKEGLRQRTADASARGIFGAPSFLAPDGELFWGDDRLDSALRWAAEL